MILALESSCDESAVALFDPQQGMRGEWIHSQIQLHGKHGGVVPDLATREHLRNFGPLLAQVPTQCPWPEIKQLAVTRGPGLAACLAIGVATAKALGSALRLPVLGINHLRGHVWSPFIPVHAKEPKRFQENLEALLPHLGLVVSGGNTLLFQITRDRRLSVISSTRDDAAGEALDKGAKLLGLGYPGGPLVERQAREGRADAFDFPRGLGPRSELDFSFSGLKTSLRYRLERMSEAEIQSAMPDLCASYQQAVVDALVRKATIVLEDFGAPFRSLGLSGGVANNGVLRQHLGQLAARRKLEFLAAKPCHTGDNAGMIAFASWVDPSAADASGHGLRIAPGLELVD